MRQEALAFRLGYITITARYRQRWWFRYGMGVAMIGGVALHLFYRWKTQGWQRAWGGWDDVTAWKDDGRPTNDD